MGCRMSDPLRSLLKSHTLSDVLPKTPSDGIVCLEHTDTVGFALRILAARDIISAPVRHRSERKAEDIPYSSEASDNRILKDICVDEVIGFVDLSIILQNFLRCAFLTPDDTPRYST